ncbi:hypothetical protein TNCV_3812311 [Trichonephila clavipes]|nr:hypothetical protein TNCV_3812311 [Trichonephila clavipes]
MVTAFFYWWGGFSATFKGNRMLSWETGRLQHFFIGGIDFLPLSKETKCDSVKLDGYSFFTGEVDFLPLSKETEWDPVELDGYSLSYWREKFSATLKEDI